MEICGDHELSALKSTADGVDLHVILSDEVYPVKEHAAAKFMLHASRVVPGIMSCTKLPSVANTHLTSVELAITAANLVDMAVIKTPYGNLLLGRV